MDNRLTKEGILKYIPGSNHQAIHGSLFSLWKTCHVKLLPNAIMEVYDNATKIDTIDLHPACTITKSRFFPFPGVFLVNTHEETAMTSGPLFAADPQEAGDWMRKLNYARASRATETKHPHPLTPYYPSLMLRYQEDKPKSSTKIFKDRFTCLCCNKTDAFLGASCEFCPEYHICNRCEQGYNFISQISRVHSPNHIHELLHFDKAQGEDWFEAGYHDGTFICDICKQTCNNGVYHCPICSYDECEKCAAAHNPAPQNVDQEMKIELGHLQQFFRTDGNDFDFDCRDPMRTPQHCSVITNKPLDLTNIETAPVPHAYCEFKLKKFLGNVSIGVGNTVFTPIQMLGYQQNSMAYFCNGSISRNNVDHRENYLPTFKRGDTIGVGVLYDSFKQRRLYFTKNGQLLDLFPYRIHKGMDVFPGISFTNRSGIAFTSILTGPFKFNPNTLPNHRDDITNYLCNIPKEIIVTCLSYAATSPSIAVSFRKISKQFVELAEHNNLWRSLFCNRWPRQNHKLKLKSWLNFYKRRNEVDKPEDLIYLPLEPVKLIENCEFEFLCPLKWENLPNSGNNNERHCDKCKKTVYRVDDEETLQNLAAQGKCVSMFKLPDPNQPFHPPMMGLPPPMPRQIPNPSQPVPSGFPYNWNPNTLM